MDKNNLLNFFLKENTKERKILATFLYLETKYLSLLRKNSLLNQITLQDCVDFVYNLVINQCNKKFVSVIYDNLAKIFPEVKFEESDPDLDHAGDIDYLGWINKKAIGIQIKPVTIKSNFGNYSASERMKASFADFEEKYGGKVFVIISLDGEIGNKEVVEQIRKEVKRLKNG